MRKNYEERGIARKATVDSMERDDTEHGVDFPPADLENLPNPNEEEDVPEELTLQERGSEVPFPENEFLSEADQDEDSEEKDLSLNQELLKYLWEEWKPL